MKRLKKLWDSIQTAHMKAEMQRPAKRRLKSLRKEHSGIKSRLDELAAKVKTIKDEQSTLREQRDEIVGQIKEVEGLLDG